MDNKYSDLVERLRNHGNISPLLLKGAEKFERYWFYETLPPIFVIAAADAIEAQAKRIAELEAALKPFADASDLHLGSDDMSIAFRIIIGNLRQARKVLGEKEDNFTEREI